MDVRRRGELRPRHHVRRAPSELRGPDGQPGWCSSAKTSRNVQANAGGFRAQLESLRDLPIVGVYEATATRRVELVKDPDDHSGPASHPPSASNSSAGRSHRDCSAQAHLAEPMTASIPWVQLAPVLTCGPDEFAERSRSSSFGAHRTPEGATAGERTDRRRCRQRSRNTEYRVAITPAGVRSGPSRGVVLVQAVPARARRSPTPRYRRATARDRGQASDVWGGWASFARSSMKTRTARESEASSTSPAGSDLVLFTYLHQAAYPEVAKALLAAGTTAVPMRRSRARVSP